MYCGLNDAIHFILLNKVILASDWSLSLGNKALIGHSFVMTMDIYLFLELSLVIRKITRISSASYLKIHCFAILNQFQRIIHL